MRQIRERTDNRYVSVSADISVIGRYIGFADIENAYRYRLSVSADKKAHIGSPTYKRHRLELHQKI